MSHGREISDSFGGQLLWMRKICNNIDQSFPTVLGYDKTFGLVHMFEKMQLLVGGEHPYGSENFNALGAVNKVVKLASFIEIWRYLSKSWWHWRGTPLTLPMPKHTTCTRSKNITKFGKKISFQESEGIFYKVPTEALIHDSTTPSPTKNVFWNKYALPL